MNNIQEIRTSLATLLKSEMPFVAMISGKWGVGKTYFWKDFVKHEKLDRVAYISLFGHSSLEDIKLAIMTEIGMIQHEKFRKFVENTKDLQFMGVGVGGFFSMLTKEDLSKIVICFDDFERLSNKLDIKDVLGLISYLKEEKKCQIIMILNEDELDHDHENGNKRSEIFTRKKEKIVDYSFYYNPTVETLFEIVQDGIKEPFDKEVLKKVFQESKLRNVRIMMQVIRCLNDFDFVKDWSFDKRVIDEFVEHAIRTFILVIKENLSYEDFEKEDEKLIDIFGLYLDFTYEQKIYKVLFDYFYTHLIDEEQLKKSLEVKNKNLQRYDFKEKASKLFASLVSDFSTPLNEICNELLSLYKEYKDDIVPLFSIDYFHGIMEIIKEHGVDIPQDFIDDIILKYLHNQPIHDGTGAWVWEESHYDEFAKKYYSRLNKDYEQEKKESGVCKEDFITYLKEDDNDKLKYLDSNFYKKFILENIEIPKLISEFLYKNHGRKDFKEIIKNILIALREIKKETPGNSWRVEQIVKKSKLKL